MPLFALEVWKLQGGRERPTLLRPHVVVADDIFIILEHRCNGGSRLSA